MRRDSREMAFKIIFESLFNESPSNQEIIDELKEKDQELFQNIIKGYNDNKQEVQAKVENLLVDFKLDRVFKVDIALLYTAICEIEYVKTPAPIVVNEIIEISKEYSTDKSPKFINGVLSTYIKNMGV